MGFAAAVVGARKFFDTGMVTSRSSGRRIHPVLKIVNFLGIPQCLKDINSFRDSGFLNSVGKPRESQTGEDPDNNDRENQFDERKRPVSLKYAHICPIYPDSPLEIASAISGDDNFATLVAEQAPLRGGVIRRHVISGG